MSTSARAKSPDLLAKLAARLGDYPIRRKYLIGVSGGRDSMLLLRALHALGYQKLVVCHLDHGLRGAQSRADAAFVAREAKKLDLPVEIKHADTKSRARENQESIELAARELRYAFFADCARRQRCRTLFLAHHAGDQVETVLFNFLRGTGSAGLSGMKFSSPRDGLTLVRPLLGVTRREIDDYVTTAKIRFREDPTNAEQIATRNKLRLGVIPAIRAALGDSFEAAILRTAEISAEEHAWMESQLPELTERLSTRALAPLHPALRRRLVHRWLRKQGIPEAGFQETARVLTLLNDGSGPAKVSLPGNWQARRRSGELFLEPSL
jgi:tRNA(Ile)-lysidine synthase